MDESSATELRAVRFALHPGNRRKGRLIAQTGGATRSVWNHFLARNQREYARHRNWAPYHEAGLVVGDAPPKPSVSFFSLGKRFTELRRETPWLQRLPFAPVRYALKYQADAWQRAFKGGGFPKFKARIGNDSFTLPDTVSLTPNGWLHIPKIGWVRLTRTGGNPYAEHKPIRAVVKQECGRWYCVVLYRVPAQARLAPGTSIGVDMNCGQVADSDGVIHRGPDIARLEARRRRYRRRMARQRKNSNRRAVTRMRLRKTQRKLRQARHNWRHHVSRTLANTAHTVVVEDLRTRSMTRSAKGTVDSPGSNVRAKAGLNRSILATGWNQLRAMLEHKAGEVIAVPPAYTSRTCRECGAVDSASRKSQSNFHCVHCGHEANADVNAALNILALGTGAAGRGGGGVARPVKRQLKPDLAAAA